MERVQLLIGLPPLPQPRHDLLLLGVHDRRASLLEATENGNDLLERALAAHVPQMTVGLMGPLTAVERLILRELVTKLLADSTRGTVATPAGP